MGATNEYFQIDPNLSCKVLENGNVGAIDNISLDDGTTIKTVVAGTTEKFIGSSIYTVPRQPPSQIPVDSRNLGDNSLTGQAATLAKLDLQKCWGKIGPSL